MPTGGPLPALSMAGLVVVILVPAGLTSNDSVGIDLGVAFAGLQASVFQKAGTGQNP